ncbi:hypothetical protein [Bacillus dakarensis]|uniref:hypothetical protein n=1 Tax=Robertmurraya dakarensis TaxID=1926278 RepID=UPI000981F80F|nr:hypothetical protein [Bacillus dakarensis]
MLGSYVRLVAVPQCSKALQQRGTGTGFIKGMRTERGLVEAGNGLHKKNENRKRISASEQRSS